MRADNTPGTVTARHEPQAPGRTPQADVATAVRERQVWEVLAAVADPEIPVLSVVDLGIVRGVRVRPDGRMHVTITTTYTGCPATDVIRIMVRAALETSGFGDAVVEELLSPPWTSEWLTAAGRDKLRSFGIAPPEEPVAEVRRLWHAAAVTCPRCASRATERVSEFGSTPCKAHYRCLACHEPFDYFKCL